MTDGTNIYTGFNNAASQGSKFAGPNATVRGAARTPFGVSGTPGAAPTAASSGLPSPLTWLLGALALLFLLKFLSEHPKTALNPQHLHIGGYNVLSIFVIVLLSVVGVKIIVNRPAFSKGVPAGFASLVNSI